MLATNKQDRLATGIMSTLMKERPGAGKNSAAEGCERSKNASKAETMAQVTVVSG